MEILWTSLSKNLNFYKLYFISFQVMTKTLFTNSYNFGRVAPSLFNRNNIFKCYTSMPSAHYICKNVLEQNIYEICAEILK